jgi:hypothetical protein
MSNQDSKPAAAPPQPPELPAAELNLGRVLALIHRVLATLDDPDRANDVQNSLRNASSFLESARLAHASEMCVNVSGHAQADVESETVAVIAAAIAAVLGRPYRMVAVQPVVAPAPHFSVWAMEGRTQIFMSHKVR